MYKVAKIQDGDRVVYHFRRGLPFEFEAIAHALEVVFEFWVLKGDNSSEGYDSGKSGSFLYAVERMPGFQYIKVSVKKERTEITGFLDDFAGVKGVCDER